MVVITFTAIGRTAGIILTAATFLWFLPYITQHAFLHSPMIGVNVILISGFILRRFYKRYGQEVSITLFHVLLNTSLAAVALYKGYFSESGLDPELSMRRARNRKIIRIAVTFIMIQRVSCPEHSLLWLHTLLAYKFAEDVASFIRAGEWKLQPQNENEPQQLQHNYLSVQKLPLPVLVAIQVFKMLFSLGVFYFLIIRANWTFMFVTVVYYTVAIGYLERPVTNLLETREIEFFEGLEQYYVKGALGVTDMLISLVLMLCSLIQHNQYLMFVALYTNLYTMGREIIQNAVTSAFMEWSVLAHFERATVSELSELDDICAVCLNKMHRARKTPCKHFFHGHCLRRCLKEKQACPICSKKFTF